MKSSPKNYGLNKFRECPIYEINLRPYLSSFIKPGWQKKVALKNYLIRLAYGRGYYGKFEGVFRDAAYNFVLLHKGSDRENALACLGFNVLKDNSIIIKQIQGVAEEKVRYHPREKLEPLRWEKMLLKIVVDWARANGFAAVKVIRAKDSGWFSIERKKAMYMKYDVTARRLGFKFNPEEKVYVFSLV